MASPITIQLDGDATGLRKTLNQTEKRLSAFGSKAGKALKAVGIAAAGGIAVAGAGAAKLAFSLDSARAEVARATGATGEDLKALTDNLTDAFGQVPDSLETVAGVLGDVRTRFAGSNEDVEALTVSILDFARVTGGEAAATAEGLGRAMKIWDIDAASADLDVLTRVTQDFGIAGDKFAGQMQKFGPVFANAGLSMDETATIMGRLHGAGQDITRVTPGLNAFFRKMADAGEAPIPALREVEEAIRNAESSSEALSIATDAFGAEGAQRLTAAIRDAGVSFGDLDGFIAGADGNLARTTKATATFGEKMREVWNRIQAQIGKKLLPVFDRLARFISENWEDWAATARRVSERVREVATQVWDRLSPAVATLRDALAAMRDALEPVVRRIVEFIRANPTPFLAALAVVVGGVAVAALWSMVTALTAAAVAMVAAISPVALVVGGLAALVGGLVLAYQKVGWFRDLVDAVADFFAEKVWPALQETAAVVKEVFEEVIWPVVEAVTGWVIDTVRGIPDFFTDDAWPVLQQTAEVVREVFERVIRPVVEAVAGFVIDQVQAVISIFDGLIDFFTGVFTGDWSKSWEAIKQIFAAVFDFMIEAPAKFVGQLGEILADIGPTLLGFGADFIELVGRGLFEGLKFIVLDMAPKMTEWLAEIAGNLLKWGGDAMAHIGRGILAGLKFLVLDLPRMLLEWQAEIVTGLVRWGGEIAFSVIDGIVDGISGAAGAVFRALRDMISAAWDRVKDVPVVGDVAGVITGGVSAVGGLVGGLFGGARGALVTQPTLALIGEAGPELLVPLDRAPGAMPLPSAPHAGAAATIVVNINGDFHGDEDRFSELGVDGLRTYVRRNGPLHELTV